MHKLTRIVKEQPNKLNFSHYSTILDKNINLVELKENISNIFSEKFDSFFSDLYPEKLDGEKEILKTNKEFNEENNSLKISGLEGIELEFKFIDNGGIKTVDFNINVGNTNLSKKQEMYLDTVFGYLEEFGLEFKSSNEFNKNITCSNGVCHFVQVVKEDLTDFKTNLNQDLLKAVLSGNGLKIKDLINQIKDNELKKSLEDFLELSVKSFNNENINKELDVLKIKIIYKIISDNYKRLIYSLDSYIKSIESNEESMDEIGNEKLQIGEKVDNIISEKDDKLVFLQVKTILEKNKEIYLKKLSNLSKEMVSKNLESSIDFGNELSIIIKTIEKEIPSNIKIEEKSINKKFLNILNQNFEKNKNIYNEEKQKKIKVIRQMIESEYKDEDGNILAYNYQLFINNFSFRINEGSDSYHYVHGQNIVYKIPFIIKDNILKINVEKRIYDVLTIIDFNIIIKINEIDKKYSSIINLERYKLVSDYIYFGKLVDNKLLDIKKNKVSNQSLGILTGEYVDIKGERFVQFNKKDATSYIGLENFHSLSTYTNNISYIDKSKFLLISGQKFYNLISNGDASGVIDFENIKLYDCGSLNVDNKYDIIKIIFDDKILFKGEEYTKVIRYYYNENYINEKGEFLEEIIENKMKNSNVLVYEYSNKNSNNVKYSSKSSKINYSYNINNFGINGIEKVLGDFFTIRTKIHGEQEKSTLLLNEFLLYFDGNDFLTEKNSGDLVIGLDEFELDGNIFYKADLIKITDKITARNNIILNKNFEALNFGDKEIIKFGYNFFEYHGKQYREVYLKYNSEPIFLNLSSKSKYTEKDQFIYEKDGKALPIYEGKNEGEILKLLVEYNGEKTTVSVSNEIGQKNVGTKLNKFFKLFS